MKPTPWSHACDVGTYDYSLVDEGTISCEDCGKLWTLDPEKGWKSDPQVEWKPGSPRPQLSYRKNKFKTKTKVKK